MLTRNQLIAHWKRWMNRNHSFSKPEMEELENHLWEEMDEMVATDGCSEEDAFAKAVVNIGSSDHVYPEFKKNQQFVKRARHYIITKSIPIIVSLLLIIVFLIGDSLFAQYHTVKVYKPITKSEIVNLYNIETKPPKLFSKLPSDKPLNELLFYNINEGDSYLSCNKFFWFSENSTILNSQPCYAGRTSSLLYVVDDKNRLWIDENEDVDQDSLFIDLIKPRKAKLNKESSNADYISFNISRTGFITTDPNNELIAYLYGIEDNFIKYTGFDSVIMLQESLFYTSVEVTNPNEALKYKDALSQSRSPNNKDMFFHVSKVIKMNKSSFLIDLETYSKKYPTVFKTLKVEYCLNKSNKKPFLTIQEVKKDHAPLHILPYFKEKVNQLITTSNQ